MLRLLPESTSPENPTIALRWCIDPSDRAKLIKLGANNVFVLINVLYENMAEDRYVCHLEEAMTYVGFRFPGTHTIYARIVWRNGDKKSVKKMNNYYLERYSRRSYRNSVLTGNSDDGFCLDNIGLSDLHALDLPEAEPVEVAVDNGHFAKEPPAWVSNWVNWLYRFPPEDQCEFRRRTIWAFTLKPFAFLSLAFLYVFACAGVLLFCTLFLARGVNIKAAFDLDQGPGEIWSDRTLWSLVDERGRPKPYRLLVTPFAFILYGSWLWYLHVKWSMGYMEVLKFILSRLKDGCMFILSLTFGLGLEFLVSVVVSIALTALGLYLVYYWVSKTLANKCEFENSPEYRKHQEAERRRSLEEAYKYLSCPRGSDPATVVSLSALPRERRTLRLRFLDMKRSVCRPFAR